MATERFDLVVIGGGPAGLAHPFWALRDNPEQKVVVLEADTIPGGKGGRLPWPRRTDRAAQYGTFASDHLSENVRSMRIAKSVE